jgi:hypothetical protein
VPRVIAPQAIVDLAEQRAVARRAGDWPAADRLRAEIESAGWRVVDTGTLYDLERAVAEDVVLDGVVRYGSSAAVPSRLAEDPNGAATVVLLATDWPDDLSRAVRALVAHAPDGTQLILVANAPSPAQAAALADPVPTGTGVHQVLTEVVWTSERLGHAAALNAGIRRAQGPVVVILDSSIEVQGDLVSALVAALADEHVAAAGPFGLVTDDLARFEQAAEGVTDVAAISGLLLAFRRDDYVVRGPLDEHFRTPDSLDAWWSLTLRDPGDGEPEDAQPRRAVQVSGIPLARHPLRGPSDSPDTAQARQARRNRYRILRTFATRRDLIVPGTGAD